MEYSGGSFGLLGTFRSTGVLTTPSTARRAYVIQHSRGNVQRVLGLGSGSRGMTSAAIEFPVERQRGVNQSQGCEGLWEVADLFSSQGNALRIKPHVLGVGQHLLEGVARLFQLPSSSE